MLNPISIIFSTQSRHIRVNESFRQVKFFKSVVGECVDESYIIHTYCSYHLESFDMLKTAFQII